MKTTFDLILPRSYVQGQNPLYILNVLIPYIIMSICTMKAFKIKKRMGFENCEILVFKRSYCQGHRSQVNMILRKHAPLPKV